MEVMPAKIADRSRDLIVIDRFIMGVCWSKFSLVVICCDSENNDSGKQ